MTSEASVKSAVKKVKEHPILFSTPMIKAILAGKKTQTRRVVKPQPDNDGGWTSCTSVHDHNIVEFCPYSQPSDRLWVRETWWKDQSGGLWGYKADGIDWPPTNCGGKAIPSIFMPRWVSRITLEITDIRVQRVQEISRVDTHAEGILRFDRDNPDVNGGVGYNRGAPNLPMRYESLAAYEDLWDSINRKKYPWASNPWVWAITFKVLK